MLQPVPALEQEISKLTDQGLRTFGGGAFETLVGASSFCLGFVACVGAFFAPADAFFGSGAVAGAVIPGIPS